MKEIKKTDKKQTTPSCPMKIPKDKNELFMLSNDNWNIQDSRRSIMNADFHQMNSARAKD